MNLMVVSGLNSSANRSAFKTVFSNAVGANVSLFEDITEVKKHLKSNPSDCCICLYQGGVNQLEEELVNIPAVEFVAFFEPPEFIVFNDGQKSLQPEYIDEWLVNNSQTLKFYMGHHTNTLLVNADVLYCRAEAMLGLFAKHFAHFEFNTQLHQSRPKLSLTEAVTLYSGTVELDRYPQAQELYEQLVSAAELTQNIADAEINARKQYWLKYLNELSIAVEAQQDNQAAEVEIQKDSLNEKNNECKSHAAENELSLLQVQQLQEELEQTLLKLAEQEQSTASASGKIKQLQSAKAKADDEIDRLNKANKTLSAENELALLQVQQLQEELEQMVLKQGSLSKADATGTEITALKKERDDLAAENELSLLQIHQLQEELEYYYTKLQQQGSLEHSIASSEDISPGMMNCIRLLSHINH
jgi:hypothetical protein